MVVKEKVSGNVYTIQIMRNSIGSSLGTMSPTELLRDIPLADGQEQHYNKMSMRSLTKTNQTIGGMLWSY